MTILDISAVTLKDLFENLSREQEDGRWWNRNPSIAIGQVDFGWVAIVELDDDEDEEYSRCEHETKMTVSQTEQKPTDKQITDYLRGFLRGMDGYGLVITNYDEVDGHLRNREYPYLRSMFGQNPDVGKKDEVSDE